MTALRRALNEARDQSLHALAAMLVLAPAIFLATGGIVLSALLVGLVRETAQHRTFKFWTLGWGSRLDLACWTFGGLLLGAIA